MPDKQMLTPLTHASLQPTAHGFFTRQGGVSVEPYASLNVALQTGDKAQAVAENRRRIKACLGATALLTAKQTHSNKTAIITQQNTDRADRPQADALVTDRVGLAIGVLTADCVPILLFEPQARLVATAHAGWKGALAGIVAATIAAMESSGASRQAIRAVIGPSISAECYEVGADLRARFAAKMPDALDLFTDAQQPTQQKQHFLFDLRGLVARQLKQEAVGSINHLAHCTYRQEAQFFSYRRSCHRHEADYGRQLSAICLMPPDRV